MSEELIEYLADRYFEVPPMIRNFYGKTFKMFVEEYYSRFKNADDVIEYWVSVYCGSEHNVFCKCGAFVIDYTCKHDYYIRCKSCGEKVLVRGGYKWKRK